MKTEQFKLDLQALEKRIRGCKKCQGTTSEAAEKACFRIQSPKSIPQWLKPPLIPLANAGDKSPAYHQNEFFRSLFSRAVNATKKRCYSLCGFLFVGFA
jgi:hypothetical protein